MIPQLTRHLNIIYHHHIKAFLHNFDPGGCDVMAKNVSGSVDVRYGIQTIFDEVVTCHIGKVSIRWMIQHCLQLAGSPSCFDILSGKPLVQSQHCHHYLLQNGA